MSDTPRTDAEVIDATFPHAEVVAAGFARQLEREQALAHQRAVRFEQESSNARETILMLRGDLHAERATNKVLFADVERLENAVSARPEELRTNDVSADRAYINGARFGFSCGERNDRKSFDEAIACREAEIKLACAPSPLARSQEKS